MAWKVREDETVLYAGHDRSTVDHEDIDRVPRTSARKKCIVILLSVALVAVLLAIIVPITLNLQSHNGNTTAPQPVAAPSGITAACTATQYPDTCTQTLQNSTSQNAKVFTTTSLSASRDGVDSVRLALENSTTPDNAAAVKVCLDVLNVADEELTYIIGVLNGTDPGTFNGTMWEDMKVRLSAAMEMHTTCKDALDEVGKDVSPQVEVLIAHTNEIFSVALSFLSLYAAVGDNFWAWARAAGYGGQRRRLLANPEDEGEGNVDEIPSWVHVQHRRHLLATSFPGSYINVTVAWNGGGNFRKIQDAVDKAPATKSNQVYVIYIKSGTYKEQVTIGSNQWNIMFIGDGIGKTIIQVNQSVALTPNMTTFFSPALIVGGKGFLMKKITVRNVAGPQGHQAVALRVSADNTAFYQCAFDSFQDTLYAHSYRQYYRECQILGTIDYMFGNGYAVFQKCVFTAKKSGILGQFNTYTAQGKTDVNMKTGLSFQNCTFDATADLVANKNTYPTYLGRPWKPYSTAVLLHCTIKAHVSPQGWVPWNQSTFGLQTSYFAEYVSNGPGATAAIIKQRVNWSHQITTVAAANAWQLRYWADPNSNYGKTALFGDSKGWVAATGFPYDLGL
ncbi:hypothetical protein KC19_1G301100 [Ceratodon purpureus]|uniref:Pectinesterase n=1 Tax=Ceratodon purpureus TaxID=3225 RepID=A0A8T0JCJ2_CERPU|nr:hypothetical protein KC19_1G301100 [Ceratodon purpureus]